MAIRLDCQKEGSGERTSLPRLEGVGLLGFLTWDTSGSASLQHAVTAGALGKMVFGLSPFPSVRDQTRQIPGFVEGTGWGSHSSDMRLLCSPGEVSEGSE